MLAALVSHIDANTLIFGALAVAAFWGAIQLGLSARGKRWYSGLARVLGAIVLIAFGILMIFCAAFGGK